jgi:hypothetical protein
MSFEIDNCIMGNLNSAISKLDQKNCNIPLSKMREYFDDFKHLTYTIIYNTKNSIILKTTCAPISLLKLIKVIQNSLLTHDFYHYRELYVQEFNKEILISIPDNPEDTQTLKLLKLESELEQYEESLHSKITEVSKIKSRIKHKKNLIFKLNNKIVPKKNIVIKSI